MTPDTALLDTRETMPATLAAVDEFCARMLAQLDVREDARESFAIQLLLREALTNAVRHAEPPLGRRIIHCAVRLYPDYVQVTVEDEGEGFDWRAALARPAAPDATSGRGLEIIRKYATTMAFNEKGNAVTFTRELKRRRPQ